MDIQGLKAKIDSVTKNDFDAIALEVFQFQSRYNKVYNTYLNHLQTDIANIKNINDIPFLPIEFFKQFPIQSVDFEAALIFESSSTTGIGISKHYLDDESRYIEAFTRSFNAVYKDYSAYCHLGLLPSYLERNNSSLVYQVNHFIQNSRYSSSGFYLHNTEDLYQQLLHNEINQIPTMLWGVTYALLDFIEQYQMQLKYTKVIETGGMKGRRKEITRMELHSLLKQGLGVHEIGGEYGMTELLSQAYSKSEGLYQCPPQMKVLVREINDPFSGPIYNRNGAVNVIDLSNLQSCAFIETSDLGKVYDDGKFEILGRLDYSDTRGCNLLVG